MKKETIKQIFGFVIVVTVMLTIGLSSFWVVRKYISFAITPTPTVEMTTVHSTSTLYNENLYNVAVKPFTLGNLHNGSILSIDLPPSDFDWSKDGKWLAAYNYQNIWIINPLDGSYYQIQNDGIAYAPTWSPSENKLAYLFKPVESADWSNSKLNIYDVDKKSETTIAKFTNCTGNTPNLFFAKQWILIDVYRSTECMIEGKSLNDSTVAINLENNEINALPNFDVRRVRFSPIDSRLIIETSKEEYFVADLNSPDYLIPATSDDQIPFGDFDWLPMGNSFYRIDSGMVYIINAKSGTIETSWSSKDLGWNSFVSPDGFFLVSDNGKLFELETGSIQSWWANNIQNICAVSWVSGHEIASVLTCKPFSKDIPDLEITIVKNNGEHIRLGNNATLFSQVKVSPEWGND
jgi:hypothetical protein